MELQTEELDATLAPAMHSGRPLLLLAVSALLGFTFALMSLLGAKGGGDIPVSDVARVNGTPLESAEYQRALQLFASEKRSAITGGDRSLILERMIEEELLVQYGVKTGLVHTNPAVRSEVLQSVMAGLTVELEARADDRRNPGQDRDGRLAEYLGQLRAAATIRRGVSDQQP